MSPVGDKPCPRWRHTATQVDGTRLVVFGGFENNTTRLNDIHVFDTASNEWTKPIVANKHLAMTPPSAEAAAAAAAAAMV